MPLIRQVMPSLMLQDLVSVQPMSGPTGQTFYMPMGPTLQMEDRVFWLPKRLKGKWGWGRRTVALYYKEGKPIFVEWGYAKAARDLAL